MKLLGNERHPRITDDRAHTIQVLEPDIVVLGHPEQLFIGKLDRVRAAASPNPLVDRTRHDKYKAEAEADDLRWLQAVRAARS